jgi:acyl-CoA thioester hydrolase
MPFPPFETRVRSYELDALGHANHAVYLNWFEQGRWDILAEAGLPAAEILRRGWGIHVVRIEVDYRAECRLGDEIRIRTRVESMRNSSMILVQSLERRAAADPEGPEDPEASNRPWVDAAAARVVAVWIGTDHRPMRIPGEIRSRLADEPGVEGV